MDLWLFSCRGYFVERNDKITKKQKKNETRMDELIEVFTIYDDSLTLLPIVNIVTNWIAADGSSTSVRFQLSS